MFRDRVFNITFIISLLWHLFWISMVTIITIPTGLSLAEYSKVYFLGPLLEKTAFEFMLDESPVKFETTYRKPVIPSYAFEVEIESPKDEIYHEPLSTFDKPFIQQSSLREVIKETKITVPHFSKGNSSIFPEYTEFKSTLTNRKIIFKPNEVPKVPMWITQGKENFKIELEFMVLPDGSVERLTPVVSSGYPEIDMIGMDYLKMWRFAPLEPSEKQTEQVGTVEIELKAER